MVLQFATGARWWLKFVLAPMLGGGGIVSFVLSASDRLDLTPPAASAPAAASNAAGQGQAEPQPLANTASPKQIAKVAHPAEAASQPNSIRTVAALHSLPAPAAQPARAAAPASHPPYLYATSRDGERIHSNKIRVHRGAAIGIHWIVDPAALTGLLHLKVENGGRSTADRVVQATGSRLVQIGSPTRLVLIEVSPEGEHDLAELEIIPD